MKKLLFYALTVLVLAGCNHANRFDSTMNKADSIMEANQENAKTSLTILKGIKPQLSEMSNAQRMRFYLLYSMAINKECDEYTSDSIMKAVVNYYNLQGSDYEKMTAHYLLGCAYRDLVYSKHQEAALASAEQTASLQRWLFGAFVALVLLVGFALFIYVRKKRTIQQKITMMQERYETEKTLLQREMEEMNALLEERQSLLESKDDLLERKKKELNFEIEKREVSIAELQERVAGFERDMNVRDIAVLEDEIQNAPLKDDFSYFLINVSEHPSTKKWEELSKFAKSKLPKLYVMLRKNKVTEREFRICILTRLMFKPGDIAVIVGCRFPEVSLTRSRLLKKIYGIDGRSSDFDKRIMLMF
jgi:large-conductance mechanosensitive channel